jgi:hypothetical protein
VVAGEKASAEILALPMNGVTGSAADMFAWYPRSAARVRTVGVTTHGNLSWG